MDLRSIIYLVNDNIEIGTKEIKISELEDYLHKSIDIGVQWLRDNVLSKRDQFTDHAQKLNYLENNILDKITYDTKFNQIIMNACHMWLKTISSIKNGTVPRRKRRSSKYENKKPELIDSTDSTESTGLPTKDCGIFLVEVSPGVYHKFIKIPHEDHFDVIPYNYFC